MVTLGFPPQILPAIQPRILSIIFIEIYPQIKPEIFPGIFFRDTLSWHSSMDSFKGNFLDFLYWFLPISIQKLPQVITSVILQGFPQEIIITFFSKIPSEIPLEVFTSRILSETFQGIAQKIHHQKYPQRFHQNFFQGFLLGVVLKFHQQFHQKLNQEFFSSNISTDSYGDLSKSSPRDFFSDSSISNASFKNSTENPPLIYWRIPPEKFQEFLNRCLRILFLRFHQTFI